MVVHNRRSNLARVATSWPFIASLGVLVVNDLYLKFAFSNWLTGKLSDFAGLFFVALILCAVFPRSNLRALTGLAVVFAFWKSPLSEPFIVAVQDLGIDWFGRIVDYSDLIALAVLPVAACMKDDSPRQAGHVKVFRKTAAIPMLGITAIAVAGTSYVPYTYNFTIRTSRVTKNLDVAAAAAIVQEIAEREKLACVACDHSKDGVVFHDPWIRLAYVIENGRTMKFTISGRTKNTNYSDTDDRIRKMIEELKWNMGHQLTDLEFISRLPEKRYDPRD